MSSLYSVGLMNQLADALEAAGYTPDDVNRMRQGRQALRGLKAVLIGEAMSRISQHIIDCDADPYLPSGCKVEKHQKGGQFEWDPTKVELYLDEDQQNDKGVSGHELRKKLEVKPVLNANLLDDLLKCLELIPEDWKSKLVCFWGTIYRDPDGSLSVRCLCWDGDHWDWHYRELDTVFHGSRPAAVRASS